MFSSYFHNMFAQEFIFCQRETFLQFKLQDDGLLNILSKIIIWGSIFALYQIESRKITIYKY